MPLLSDLKTNFTQFLLDDVAGFGSVYSFRFYQLMMQFKSTGYCKISLDDLRYFLALFEKYDATKDLRKWVIDTAVSEINEKTAYKVTYELLKTGRKFTHLELKFKPKKVDKAINKVDPKRYPDTPDFFVKMTDAQRNKFGSKLAYDERVQSDYSHLVGTGNYEQFGQLLAEMLVEEKYFKTFLPLLLEHGFKL